MNMFAIYRSVFITNIRLTPGPAAVLIGLLLSASSLTALADTAPAEAAPKQTGPGAGDQLTEIVVTAEKRASTVQSTPISITAFSGEQLQAQGVTNVMALAGQTPGISMRSSGPGQTELEMRGMASSGGSSPTVGFYLDETPLTPPAASLNGKVVIDPDLFDLNRVEVLRGPQGTLYGAGSMGGTIKLVTNAPDLKKFESNVEGILSNTDGGGLNGGANAMLSVPLIDDKLAIRMVVTDKHYDGWIDRIVVSPFPAAANPCAAYSAGTNVGCTRGDVLGAPHVKDVHNVNSQNLQSARISLLAKPNDDLTINTLFMYQRLTAGGYSEYDLPPGPTPVLAHYQPFDTREPFSDYFRLGSLTVAYDFGGATMTSNTSYWTREEKQSQDISEALRSNFGVFYGVDILAPIVFTEDDKSHQFSEEIRLASNGNGSFSWLGGLFYSQLESIFWDTNQAPAFAPASVGGAAANPLGIVYDAYNPYHVKQYAVFGEGSYLFTPHWKMTLGLRWYDYKTQVDETQEGNLTASGNATPTIASYSTSASGFNPKVNFSWMPSKDLTVYASASKGFRPGGVNQPLPPFCQAQQETYGPDSIWDYELGEKARFLDQRITLNADFYYIRWSNVQQAINQACGYALTAVAGDAVSYGPEIELTVRMTPELTLDINGAYTTAHLTTVNSSTSQVSTTPLAPGTPITNIPKYTESTSLTYTRPVSDNYSLVLRASNSLVGPVTDTSFTFTRLSPYDLVALRAGLKSDHLSGYLFVDNLTNKIAELSTNTTTFSWIVPSITRVATNRPRTIGIDLSYRF
jgi:iron complex outermembrane recepter protein